MISFMSCVTGLKAALLLIDWICNGHVMFEDRPVEVHPHIFGRLVHLGPPLPDYPDFIPYRFKRPYGSKKHPVSGTTRTGCEKINTKALSLK